MELTWYGIDSFRMMERGSASVVTDPYPDDFGLVHPRPRGDIITVSNDDPFRSYVKAVRGPSRFLDGPGEYEIGGVFVTGVAFSRPERRNKVSRRHLVFVFDYEGLTVCHLGGLDHVPGQSQLESLGTVNVLLTPVGGSDVLSVSQAAEVISMLEPNIVVPMHYHIPPGTLKLPGVQPFLKEMGANQVESVDVLKVTSTSLPEETQVILLTRYQNG